MNLKNKRLTVTLGLLLLAVKMQICAAQSIWTLDKCLDYAADHNQGLLGARQRLAVARTATGQSKARLLPIVTGSASLDHYWQIPVQVFPGELLGQPQGTFIPVRLGTPWMGNAGLQANLSLVDAEGWNQIKTSMLEQQLKASQNHSEQKLVTKNVRMAYYATVLHQQDYHTAEIRIRDFQESHRLIALNFEKGITDQIAVNQSLTLLEDLGDEAAGIRASYLQSLLDLKFWMGFPLADSISIDTGGISFPEAAPQTDFNAQLLPDFTQDSLTVDIARATVRQSTAALYPELSVVSGYSRLGFGSEASFITRSKWFSSGYVGLRLSMPIFDMPRMHYQVKKNKESVLLAQAERQAGISSGNKAFLAAKIGYDRALQELKSLQTKEALARENIGLSTKKMQKGIIDMIQMKQLQDELTIIRRKRLAARMQCLIQIVELEYLQGN